MNQPLLYPLRLLAGPIVCIFAALSAFGQMPMADALVVSPADSLTLLAADTLVTPSPQAVAVDRLTAPVSVKADAPSLDLTSAEKKRLEQMALPQKKAFIPDPQRALWLSLILPGAGQIYNRKYWKLPIVYGGFLGCTYAFLWNQQMYMDYSQAYLDIMDSDPNTNSYKNMFPPTYDIESRLDQFKTVFKSRKDRYRRWRDLSAFCFVGVYLLSVVDAYVDAQLSVFDISPDLSLRITPTVFDTPGSLNGGFSGGGFNASPTLGLGASLSF